MSEQGRLLKRHGLLVTQARVRILCVLQEAGRVLSVADIKARLKERGDSLATPTISNVLKSFQASRLFQALGIKPAEQDADRP